jgi:hypothetical protein
MIDFLFGAAQGATAGVVADKATDILQQDDPLVAILSELRSIRLGMHEVFNRIKTDVVEDIDKAFPLTPFETVIPNHTHKYIFLFMPISAAILLSVPGMGQFNLTLTQGWNSIDFHSATISLVAGSVGTIAAIIRFSNSPTIAGQPQSLQASILAGQSFNAMMPNLAPGTSGNYAWQLFNSSNNKNIFIYSLQYLTGAGNSAILCSETAASAMAGSANCTITNSNLQSNNASVATANYSTTGGIPTIASQINLQIPAANTNQSTEILTNGAGILLPKGSSMGILLYTFVNSGNAFSVCARYLEF